MRVSTGLMLVIGLLLSVAIGRAAPSLVDVPCDAAALIAAVSTANSNGTDDTLTLSAGCTYMMSAGLSVSADGGHTLHIDGQGATLDGSGLGAFRLLTVAAGATLTLESLTLSDAPGGAIQNEGTLAMDGGAVQHASSPLGAVLNIGTLTVSGAVFSENNSSAIRAMTGATTTLIDVTFSDNVALPAYGGAGAISNQGALTITGGLFQRNDGVNGGAINTADADVTISSTSFSENTASAGGGAIQALGAGTVTIHDATFNANLALAERGDLSPGGAILCSGGVMTISGTRFNGDQSRTSVGNDGRGGSIAVLDGGTLTLRESSIDASQADGSGGAVYNEGTLTLAQVSIAQTSAAVGGAVTSDGTLTLTQSTISGGSATDTGGVYVTASGTATLRGTIIAGNSGANPDLRGIVSSSGHNLIGDPTGSNLTGSPGPGDLFGVDPLLGPMQDNGGAALTMLPDASSPAIDAGDCTGLGLTTDGRGAGFLRLADDPALPNAADGCDIGAVERQQCPDGTASAETLVCQAMLPHPSNNDRVLHGGDDADSLTVAGGAAVDLLLGDAPAVALSEAACDYDLAADAVAGPGADDTLLNLGTVRCDIAGDLVTGGTGGADHITNRGTVNGHILGDGPGTAAGDDTIISSGTVEGCISAGGGDDLVIVEDGADGGTDATLCLEGGAGSDTLRFVLNVSDPAAFTALQDEFDAAAPAAGSLVYNGQTFTWAGFETLDLIAPISRVVVGDEATAYDAMALAIAAGQGGHIAFVLPDFRPDGMALTVRLQDGTLVTGTVTLHAGPPLTLSHGAWTVNGAPAPDSVRQIVAQDLPPLLIAVLDRLIIDRRGTLGTPVLAVTMDETTLTLALGR